VLWAAAGVAAEISTKQRAANPVNVVVIIASTAA